MPYATAEQIASRLPTVDMENEDYFATTIAEALAWADSEIHLGLAGAGYTLPFSPAPETIKQLAADFGQVFVLRTNSETRDQANDLYKQLLAKLAVMASRGIPDLPKPEPVEELPPAIGLAYHTQMGQRPQIESNPLSPFYEGSSQSGKPGGSWPW